MPRISPKIDVSEAAQAADKKPRTAAKLANDARLRRGPTIIARKTHGPDDVKDEINERIDISTSGEANATRAGIDIVNPSRMLSKAEDAKFMNEIVEIQIEADDDPHAPLFVHSAHNGESQYIKRGEPQKVKRRFLYSLIAAKQAKLVCAFGKDQNGQEFNKLSGPKRCTHRVIVINDTARGRQKYNEWMAQP